VATSTSTPVPGPCATNLPDKRTAIDIGIGLGGAAVAGVVGGLVVILRDEMTTRGYPTPFPNAPPSTQMNSSTNNYLQVNMNPTQMSRMVYNINNSTKKTIRSDAAKLAGGFSIFMIIGAIALFCLLAVLLRAGFKKTRAKVKEQADEEMKKMKKYQEETHKDQKKTRDGLVAPGSSSRTLEVKAPLIQKEKHEKKKKKDKNETKAKSGDGSGSNHGSSSSSSSSSSSESSDGEHSNKRHLGCCV